MRLSKIQQFLREHGVAYNYTEERGCGSIDFQHRELRYRVWEFPPLGSGAESNVRTAGRGEDFTGDYENEILGIINNWY